MKKVTLPVNFKNYDFKNLAKKEKNAALKVRYLALSHIAMGKTVLEAAAIVHKSNRMLHRWLNRLDQFGLEGLKDKPGRGRDLYLPLTKEAEFKDIVLQFTRTNAKNKITGYDVKQLLERHYNIDCTLPTAYNIILRLDLKDKEIK
ncbi:MAG TPA: helix-turn-helix domain-containing protein [Burkholderiales bacterium]|mgnify:CR=1 FL=1|nr:helix-turn-helix domain-containing protein [Burkholderiales bacterium]